MRVFIDLSGQDDNLGDAILRRALLHALPATAQDVTVLANGSSPAYVSGLQVPKSHHLTLSRGSWTRELLSSVLAARTAFVMNAGEARADASRNIADFRMLSAVRMIRLRGGVVLQTGLGLRAADDERNAGVQRLAKIVNLSTWRDPESARRARGGRVQPDWAFALGHAGEPVNARDSLAITMRGDRDYPGKPWFDHVRGLAKATGLRPVVYTQVRRDNDMAAAIAAELGAPHRLWPEDESHADWEPRVRELLAVSGAVVSDRVHALIVGATEGAVPIGLARQSAEKLERTLAGAGLYGFTFSSNDEFDGEDLLEATTRRGEVLTAVDLARNVLTELADEMAGLLDAAGSPSRRSREATAARQPD